MRRAALVLAAAVLLGAAACSGDDDDASTTTTAGDGGDDTTTTTGAASTTSTTRVAACPEPEPVSGDDIVETTDADADVDGDGAVDDVYSFHTTDGVRVQVELATGDVIAEDLDPASEPRGVVTTTDLGRDGGAELWVHVGSGASTDVYGLFDLDGCDLEPVQLGGGPAEFAVGGPVLLLQGVRCEPDGRVTHLGATSEDGESFTTLDLSYELRDGELVRVGDATATLTAADPELQAYASFDCS